MKRGKLTVVAVALVCGAVLLADFLTNGLKSRGGPIRPDLVLITIDTLRADRLELYGNERETAPAARPVG